MNNEQILYPVNTRRSPSVGVLLARRLQRWHNIIPTPDEHLVYAEMPHDETPY